jgi:hypothetical protein
MPMPTNSRVLKPISDYVAKTEIEVAGVNADALDAAEARSLIMKSAAKAYNAKKKKKAAEAAARITMAMPWKPRVPPTAVVPSAVVSNLAKATTAAKFIGGVASKAPPVQAFINAYEAMSLATDPEARKKADEQSKIMAARDRLHYADISKNAAQGFLDPMGTIYTAGKGIMSESFRVGLKEQIKEMIFGSR